MLLREDTFTRAQQQRAERVLNRVCTKANSYGRDIEPLVRAGDVVDEIVDCARKRDIDCIVITEHSRPNYAYSGVASRKRSPWIVTFLSRSSGDSRRSPLGQSGQN